MAYIYEKITNHIEAMIHEGSLGAGDKLPSLRDITRNMGVSLTSALRAYTQLEGMGLIEAAPKSGYFVRQRARLAEPNPSRKTDAQPCAVSKATIISEFLSSIDDPEHFLFGCATPHPDLLPSKKLAQIASRIFKNEPRIIDYQFPPGLFDLRSQIALRALDHHCGFRSKDVVITAGCLNAINLCLRTTCKAGDTIVIQTPTYFGILQTLEHLGLKTITVPMHPKKGLDMDCYERSVRRPEVKASLLISNFNNPQGSCIPENQKKLIASLAARHHKPVIEDDIYGDLYFGAQRPKAIKAFDEHHWVLYCSSFSKTLAPGLRVGWVASERFVDKIKPLHFMTSVAAVTPSQWIIAEFLKSGHYEKHTRRFRNLMRINTERTRQLIHEAFPKGTCVSDPRGGFSLWVAVPGNLDMFHLFHQAEKQGISFVPGQLFSPHDEYQNYMRITCAHEWTEAMQIKLAKLGKLVSQACER